MNLLREKAVLWSILVLSSCRIGESEETSDVQAPRKGPVAALLSRDHKIIGAVDPWALMLPTAMLENSEGLGPDKVVDICKIKSASLAPESSIPTCLNGIGQISDTSKEGDCLGSEYDRTSGLALMPLRNAVVVMAEILCKAKDMGFVSPAKKAATIDLTDLKDNFSLRSGDRVSFSEVFLKAEKQTKGMFHIFAKGNLVDRGTRFSYDLVHTLQDKWNKESGGRIVVSEQKGDRQVVVSALYSVEEGVLALRATRLEMKPLATMDRVLTLLNTTTGLLDINELAKQGSTLSLLSWPKKIDVERDLNRGVTRVASQQMGDWAGNTSTISLAAVHRENGIDQGCGIVSLGGKWGLMSRIVPAGMLCAKGGKLELFAQKECYFKKPSSEGWAAKEKKTSFLAAADCGFGTSAFNLELLNEEGNTHDVQTFDPSPPSLAGIGPPAL